MKIGKSKPKLGDIAVLYSGIGEPSDAIEPHETCEPIDSCDISIK